MAGIYRKTGNTIGLISAVTERRTRLSMDDNISPANVDRSTIDDEDTRGTRVMTGLERFCARFGHLEKYRLLNQAHNQ